MIVARLTPLTYSITMKGPTSSCPTSNTCTMFACSSRATTRASSRNMRTNNGSAACSAWIRLSTTSFSNPATPCRRHRYTSASDPRPICPTTRNLTLNPVFHVTLPRDCWLGRRRSPPSISLLRPGCVEPDVRSVRCCSLSARCGLRQSPATTSCPQPRSWLLLRFPEPGRRHPPPIGPSWRRASTTNPRGWSGSAIWASGCSSTGAWTARSARTSATRWRAPARTTASATSRSCPGPSIRASSTPRTGPCWPGWPGMKYVVFTTKHHSGFAMWNTRTTPFNVMRTPGPTRPAGRGRARLPGPGHRRGPLLFAGGLPLAAHQRQARHPPPPPGRAAPARIPA